VAEHVQRLRSHGASVSDLDRHRAQGLVYETYEELGYNYRLTDIQAAIGIEQLKRLDDLLTRRRAVAKRYNMAFCDVEQILTPAEPSYATHAYQSYAIRLRPDCRIGRDGMMRALIEAGVSCRRAFRRRISSRSTRGGSMERMSRCRSPRRLPPTLSSFRCTRRCPKPIRPG
jgi:dTDP-4-amino-4,6-dideoxygalactose transaminase